MLDELTSESIKDNSCLIRFCWDTFGLEVLLMKVKLHKSHYRITDSIVHRGVGLLSSQRRNSVVVCKGIG